MYKRDKIDLSYLFAKSFSEVAVLKIQIWPPSNGTLV